MCCLVLLAFGIGPRVVLAGWWIFGDSVDAAFGSWIWPLLGILLVPWTTLFYVGAWALLDGLTGPEWLLLTPGVVLDISTYAARSAKARYATG
jgi:hypothetical protein